MLTRLHFWLGSAIVVAFLVLALFGFVLRIMRREEEPTAFRAIQFWTENLLILQTVGGIVLLLMGRRVVGEGFVILHYFYGSLFPFIAIVGGRIAALRRERHDYVGLAWGAFFALGLTARAMLTGLQSTGRSLWDLL